MDKDMKQKIALVVVAFLLIVKFIFLPQHEKQNELINEITQVRYVNEKYEHLLRQKEELEAFNGKVIDIESSMQKAMPIFSSESNFRLETQKEIEAAIAQYNLKIKWFRWKNSDNNTVVDYIHKKTLIINLRGQTKKLIELHTWLKQKMPKYKLKSFRINSDKKNQDSMGTFNGTIVVLAFYKEEKVS